LNKTPISRQALETVYYETLQPFFKGLTKMAQEFDNLFAVIEFPDMSLSLLDSLDTTLYFAWWEFVVEQSLSFELEIQIHFNRYDYVIEWKIKDSSYHKKIQKDYDSSFANVAQLDCINELGRFIIDQVKDKYQ
jgi:hypothetical protein